MLPVTSPLLITSGEPAGIGPDLCIQLAQVKQSLDWCVIGDAELMQQRAKDLGLPLTLLAHDSPQVAGAGEIKLLPLQLKAPVTTGQLNSDNAAYVLEMLEMAVDGCLDGRFSAMVTGPIHKGVINEAGIPFTGHTEFLAARTNTPRVVMMLATEGLRVALVTTHLPLSEVSHSITPTLLSEIVDVLQHDLKNKLGIENPHILVCGLNPHAGEGGHMGREEIEVIAPVLEQKRLQGMQLFGPLPADTLFTPRYLNEADAVLAMYHDQGLPVLKFKGFGQAVNITLGLPFIRTSVDHGTALDLAGSGNADIGSLQTALQYAAQMAHTGKPNGR